MNVFTVSIGHRRTAAKFAPSALRPKSRLKSAPLCRTGNAKRATMAVPRASMHPTRPVSAVHRASFCMKVAVSKHALLVLSALMESARRAMPNAKNVQTFQVQAAQVALMTQSYTTADASLDAHWARTNWEVRVTSARGTAAKAAQGRSLMNAPSATVATSSPMACASNHVQPVPSKMQQRATFAMREMSV